ncbi:hypothetical protein [Parathalassolituus penaei]|uniref:Uncharacterized protein n=1 Tax=Parathalassolituus penaei TaxID=2997323 RepID=A0A9X3IR56_9GAMM|nr:hypothetical protein [Parathalassolituus penaei]MCY0964882.1 hypothetical protein [Parathalassolituus penaei]
MDAIYHPHLTGNTNMTAIAVLYDSSCPCSAAMSWLLEEQIQWATLIPCDLLTCQAEDIQPWKHLIMALPIHAMGHPDDPWGDAWPVLEQVSFADKQVALWALGSDFCFDEDRLQTLSCLRQRLLFRGARLLGDAPELQWRPPVSHNLTSSRLIHCSSGRICQQGISQPLLEQWLDCLRLATDQRALIPVLPR